MTPNAADAPAHLDSGTITVASPFAVHETVLRLERQIEASGLSLFAVMDHGIAARGIGVPMADTQLLIFGGPRVGTSAMAAARPLALELPLKALVWSDDRHRVWVSFPDGTDLGRRYGVADELMKPWELVGSLVSAALSA